MAITNHERIGKCLEQLAAGLQPFVERELKSTYQSEWAADWNTPQEDEAWRDL